MSDISKRIQQRREELGLTIQQVADRLGKNRTTVYRYETSYIENLPITVLEPLAKVLQTTPAYLMGWTDEIQPTKTPKNIYPIEIRRIPILGNISCGKPSYANEDRESYVLAGTNMQADFCLKADGDSMINARINNGDIVFIKKQDIVENGEIAAVLIDDEATLKRVYYYPKENRIMLMAENPNYPPLSYSGADLGAIHILGKAIAFQSDVR